MRSGGRSASATVARRREVVMVGARQGLERDQGRDVTEQRRGREPGDVGRARPADDALPGDGRAVEPVGDLGRAADACRSSTATKSVTRRFDAHRAVPRDRAALRATAAEVHRQSGAPEAPGRARGAARACTAPAERAAVGLRERVAPARAGPTAAQRIFRASVEPRSRPASSDPDASAAIAAIANSAMSSVEAGVLDRGGARLRSRLHRRARLGRAAARGVRRGCPVCAGSGQPSRASRTRVTDSGRRCGSRREPASPARRSSR